MKTSTILLLAVIACLHYATAEPRKVYNVCREIKDFIKAVALPLSKEHVKMLIEKFRAKAHGKPSVVTKDIIARPPWYNQKTYSVPDETLFSSLSTGVVPLQTLSFFARPDEWAFLMVVLSFDQRKSEHSEKKHLGALSVACSTNPSRRNQHCLDMYFQVEPYTESHSEKLTQFLYHGEGDYEPVFADWRDICRETFQSYYIVNYYGLIVLYGPDEDLPVILMDTGDIMKEMAARFTEVRNMFSDPNARFPEEKIYLWHEYGKYLIYPPEEKGTPRETYVPSILPRSVAKSFHLLAKKKSDSKTSTKPKVSAAVKTS